MGGSLYSGMSGSLYSGILNRNEWHCQTEITRIKQNEKSLQEFLCPEQSFRRQNDKKALVVVMKTVSIISKLKMESKNRNYKVVNGQQTKCKPPGLINTLPLKTRLAVSG
jgi:hypothetical protein